MSEAQRDRLQEAARWFAARRRGVMTLEERALCAEWVRDKENAAAMAELERTWSMVEVAHHEFRDDNNFVATMRRPRFARSIAVAAVCAVSLGLGVLSYSGDAHFWTALNWSDR